MQREALNITCKLDTLHANYRIAMEKGEARQAYKLILETIKLDEDLQAIYQNNEADPITKCGTIIMYHSLKLLARGRRFIDKEGNIKFTPTNLQAQTLLDAGENDTSRIKEDLAGEVIACICQKIKEGKITVSEEAKIILTNESDEETLKDVFNVTQNEFYRHQQRHYKHEYRPIIDDEGNEDAVMITAAMREYEKSISYIGEEVLFETLKVKLTKREEAILRSKLEQKQVERAYSDNGVSKKCYVTRYKTLKEISEETGYTIKEVRNSLQWIKIACMNIARYNEEIRLEIKARTGK